MMTSTALTEAAWAKKTPIPALRSHTPAITYKDRIFLFGGGGVQFSSQNSVYAYFPHEDRWERLGNMPTARSGTVAALLGDRIFVMGGGFKQENGQFRFLTDVEIYDPHTDTWERGPCLLQPHDYPAVAVDENNNIYVLGGHHPDATTGGPKTDPGFDFCERLDLRTGRWEQIAPLSIPRFALAGSVYEGRIRAMGGVAFTPEGFNNFTTVETYDVPADAWRSEPAFALPWPAAGLGTCVLRDRLYIFGGYSTDDIHPRAAYYDAEAGEWRRLPDMPAPLCAMGVATFEESIYLFGGWADDGRTPQNHVFCLTPGKDAGR